jgi:1,2-diacylglycerol 3-alpha-glucosyltransferase
VTDLVKDSMAIVVHWPRLGPYHLARLRAAAKLLSQQHMRLVALEISGSDKAYLWESPSHAERFDRHTLFPDVMLEEIPDGKLFSKLWSFLKATRPSAVVMNGYSTKDVIVLLLWCRLNGSSPVLMSESKVDDSPRKNWIEFVKSLIVRQFDSALCGGTPQNAYLKQLGMALHKIFVGYDAVDNQFFMDGSDVVRQSPDSYRNLPGLEHKQRFFLASGRFIPRKNFTGLLQSYAAYKELCHQNRHDPWRLVLLGDGPERDALQANIESLQISRDVTLAGVQFYPNLPAYYGLASAFIHPALQDQWGLVVNEAMASGLPVLVSEQAGCAYDLVDDGVEGFKFDPDDTQYLALLMHRISSGQVDLQRMGGLARHKISFWGVERFSQGLYQAVRIGLSV